MHRLRSGLLWMAALAGLALLTGLLLPGCSVGYVTRQSATHLRVMAARQPVDKAIAAGDIPPAWLEAMYIPERWSLHGAGSVEVVSR